MDPKSFRRTLRKYQTPAESAFWYLVRAKRFEGLKFRRQHSIGKYTVDFYCAKLKLIVEIDGKVHDTPGQWAYDDSRDQDLRAKGYYVLRIENDSVLNFPEVVVEYVNSFINDIDGGNQPLCPSDISP